MLVFGVEVRVNVPIQVIAHIKRGFNVRPLNDFRDVRGDLANNSELQMRKIFFEFGISSTVTSTTHFR